MPGYSNLQKNRSYPSGHTTTAYSWGVALADMIPELAPHIMARTSEAGNNRIVLGVHYPLDIMGGRIGGSAQNGRMAWKRPDVDSGRKGHDSDRDLYA